MSIAPTCCPSRPDEILEVGRWGKLVAVGGIDTLAGAMAQAPLLLAVGRLEVQKDHSTLPARPGPARCRLVMTWHLPVKSTRGLIRRGSHRKSGGPWPSTRSTRQSTIICVSCKSQSLDHRDSRARIDAAFVSKIEAARFGGSDRVGTI